MARKPEVHYWDSRGAYYCTHNGGQHMLAKGPKDDPDGPTYRMARERFNEIVFGIVRGLTLRSLTEKYLEWAKHNLQPATAKIRQKTMKQLNDAFGERHVQTLTVYDVQAYCDSKRDSRGWNDGNVRMKMVTLKACLNWAVEMGLIKENPVGKLKPPQSGSRGLEVCLSETEESAVLAACKGRALDVVQTLRDTGARPGELARVEAQHYDPRLRAFVLQANARNREQRHKTAKTGRPRVIYLCPRSTEIAERLIRQHPTGPLFRTIRRPKGSGGKGERGAWQVWHYRVLFRRLRKQLGIKRLMAYSFRHTFAVRWLRARKPIEALAEVLGTSVLMIQRHYGHLADQRDYLRRLVDELDDERLGG